MKNPEYCPLTWLIRLQTLTPTRRSPASQSSSTNPSRAELNERTGLYSFLLRADFLEKVGSDAAKLADMDPREYAATKGAELGLRMVNQPVGMLEPGFSVSVTVTGVAADA